MNSKTAYVFDWDNVMLKSDLLLPALDQLYSEIYPEIEQGMLTESYRNYKKDHENKVHMPNILTELAQQHGIPENQYEEFLALYRGMDISNLLMDPSHSLIRKLGAEHVYILTKGDTEFQQWKIDSAKLPDEFYEKEHIKIVEEKTDDIYSQKVRELLAHGYEHIVFINDSLKELRDSSVAGPDGRI